MDFDRYTVVLLVTPENAPQLSEEERDRLQDAHLDHLADLHERQAGVFELVAMPWMLPAGAMHFTPTTFPRSTDDV